MKSKLHWFTTQGSLHDTEIMMQVNSNYSNTDKNLHNLTIKI